MRFNSFTLIVLIAFAICLSVADARTDVGEVSFPNSGKGEAQSAFLRGLALLHNFEYEDAADNFQKAQKIDPQFVMAYWGEAMTKNHPVWMEQDRDAAVTILKRLAPTPEGRIAKASTDREKDYMAAIEKLYGDGDKNQRDFDYSDAMKRVYEKYPEDPDAASFYALSLLGTAHEGRDFRIYMHAAAILEEVFRNHPQHPGAVHYLIHCYDDPIHAPLGLRAARIYSKIAPAAGHAQHMTSHIFIALGMWDDVVRANEIAIAVMNAGLQKKNMPVSACGHYNFWLEYGYLQQGRIEDAKKVLKQCYDFVSKSESVAQNPMPNMPHSDKSKAGPFMQMWARFLLDTGMKDSEVMSWKMPLADHYGARLTYEFINTLAAAQRKDLTTAKEGISRFEDARKAVEEELQKEGESGIAYRKRPEILEQQLQGIILAAEGKITESLTMIRQTADKEDALPFEFGPPFIDKPSHELLGEMLLKTQPQEAAREFRAVLDRAPGRTPALSGLALALEKSGNHQRANEILNELREIRHEDNKLTEQKNRMK